MQPITARQPPGDGQAQRQQQADGGDALDDALRLQLDRRVLARDAGQRLADAAECAAFAGGHDAAARRALGDQRAGEGPGGVGAFRRGARVARRSRSGYGPLHHRRGFAGEQRFVDRQVRCLDQSHVAGHAVAFGQQHDVADHQVAAGDALRLAVAHHQCARTGQVAQGVQRALGSALLHEADTHDHEDEAEQHEGLVAVAEQHVDGAAGHQQQEHRLGHHLAQQAQHAAWPRCRQLVGTVASQPLACLGLAQAREHQCGTKCAVIRSRILRSITLRKP